MASFSSIDRPRVHRLFAGPNFELRIDAFFSIRLLLANISEKKRQLVNNTSYLLVRKPVKMPKNH